MKHLARLILLLAALTFTCQGSTASAHSQTHHRDEVAQLAKKANSDKDRLRHETLAEQPTPVAMLSNAQNNYRFSSSRPQRLLPVYGSKQHRLGGRSPFTYKCKSTFKCHFGGRFVPLSAPFQAAAPCDYYIIALRRIVR